MKKIKVKVCAGKNCERSGGLKVKKLLKRLPDGLSDLVKAKECECLDLRWPRTGGFQAGAK